MFIKMHVIFKIEQSAIKKYTHLFETLYIYYMKVA